MIGITDLIVTSTSRMFIEGLAKLYKASGNSIIVKAEKSNIGFHIKLPEDIRNEEKEGIFAGLVSKIKHLKDPSDPIMDTKIEVQYLQQASKEYKFSGGELVQYRGFIDTDNPLPMITKLMVHLNQ